MSWNGSTSAFIWNSRPVTKSLLGCGVNVKRVSADQTNYTFGFSPKRRAIA